MRHCAGVAANIYGGRSEQAVLYFYGYSLDDGVLAVGVGVVVAFEVDSEEASECLPESGSERSEECLDDVVGALVGFASDEFDEQLCLAFGEFLKHGLVLLEDLVLHFLEVFLAFALCGECLDVFVGFEQRGAYKFGVGQCLLYVAHCAPIEFFLFLVFEFQRREYGDLVEHNHLDVLSVDVGPVVAFVDIAQCRGVFDHRYGDFYIGLRGSCQCGRDR